MAVHPPSRPDAAPLANVPTDRLMTDPLSVTDERPVPPLTLRIASIGAGASVLFALLSLVALLPGGVMTLERISLPLQFLVIVAVAAMIWSGIQAIVLLTRDRQLLKRHRTSWIFAVALGGPVAGTVFVLWYARRTAD